jgi:hypothetical protein
MSWTKETLNQKLQQGRVTLGAQPCHRPTYSREPVSDLLPQRAKVQLSESKDIQKLNKLERSFLEVLKARGCQKIWVQAFTLKIGDDCRYTPDFLALEEDCSLTCYETKGFMRDDALVKLKTAARSFNCFKFVLVEKKAGQWMEKEIAP